MAFLKSLRDFFFLPKDQTPSIDSPGSNPTGIPDDSEKEFTHFSDLPKVSSDVIKDVVYPPKDSPVPIVSVNYVLSTQVELLEKLKTSIPINEEEKDKYLFPVIRNLANYVHLLPASQSHHHNGRGGLFRHSLEVALKACRMANTRIFDPNDDPKEMHRNNGRWFLAIAVAGLIHDVGKSVIDITVTAEGGENIWKAASMPLTEWLRHYHIQRYFVTWDYGRIAGQHESASSYLASQIIPMETINYIQDSYSKKLIGELMEAMAGKPSKDSVIGNLVIQADMYSTQEDITRQLTVGQHPGVDTPIAVKVEKIIRDLIEEQKLSVNLPQSPIIVSDQGVFIVWNRAYPTILKRIQEDGITSIPRNPDKLAEALCTYGFTNSLFVNAQDVGRPFWLILPAFEYRNCDPNNPPNWNYLSCLKVTREAQLFEHGLPTATCVVMRHKPVTEEEREHWIQLTGIDAPQAQDWITPEVLAQQDQEAKRHSALSDEATIYDADGVPVITADIPFDMSNTLETDSTVSPVPTPMAGNTGVYPSASIDRILFEMGTSRKDMENLTLDVNDQSEKLNKDSTTIVASIDPESGQHRHVKAIDTKLFSPQTVETKTKKKESNKPVEKKPAEKPSTAKAKPNVKNTPVNEVKSKQEPKPKVEEKPLEMPNDISMTVGIEEMDSIDDQAEAMMHSAMGLDSDDLSMEYESFEEGSISAANDETEELISTASLSENPTPVEAPKKQTAPKALDEATVKKPETDQPAVNPLFMPPSTKDVKTKEKTTTAERKEPRNVADKPKTAASNKPSRQFEPKVTSRSDKKTQTNNKSSVPLQPKKTLEAKEPEKKVNPSVKEKVIAPTKTQDQTENSTLKATALSALERDRILKETVLQLKKEILAREGQLVRTLWYENDYACTSSKETEDKLSEVGIQMSALKLMAKKMTKVFPKLIVDTGRGVIMLETARDIAP